MDKRTFYIICAAMVFALIVLLVLLSVLGTKKQQPAVSESRTVYQEQTPAQNEFENDNLPTAAEVSPVIDSSTEIAVKSFYDWYVNHPNPLGSGEYLTKLNATDHYMEVMQGFVNRGDHLDSDPVLTCVDVKAPKDVIYQPAQYDSGKLNAFVIVQENIPGGRSLYKFILKNINGKWLVEDVRCNL